MTNDSDTETLKLKNQLRTFIAQARQNEEKMSRFQEQELRLISTRSLHELIQMVITDYRVSFELDCVSLAVIDTHSELLCILGDEGLDPEQLPEFKLLLEGALDPIHAAPYTPVLGGFQPSQHGLLFQNIAQVPASVALMPLVRHGVLIGSLNLGSDRPERFVTGTSTDFLEHLAAIVAICIENSLNHERLKKIGLTDPLTRVNNRRFFDQRLGEEVADALRHRQCLSCMFLDIDKFKRVNDESGHHAGDLVLQEVAMLIDSQLRTSDIIARYGGEEFVVLLPNTSVELALEIAERIRQRVEEHDFLIPEQGSLRVTISIGVSELSVAPGAVIHNQGARARALVESADQALFKAKEGGRNQIISAEGIAK